MLTTYAEYLYWVPVLNTCIEYLNWVVEDYRDEKWEQIQEYKFGMVKTTMTVLFTWRQYRGCTTGSV